MFIANESASLSVKIAAPALRLVFVLILLLTSCAPSRKPVPPGVIPDPRPPTKSEEQYGHEVLSQLSDRYPLEYNHPRYDNLVKVVERLTTAAHADKYPWHIYLFRDDSYLNAAATRGNHVFVWTALLDKTQNDDELATILSHEIAHLLAGHTDPDPSEQVKKILINVGSIAATIAVARATGDPTLAQNLGRLGGGVTEQLGNSLLVFPYSRELELEADRIGIFLMAAAGYNPETALAFWKRAETDPAFSSGIQFLSSHPAPDDRIEQLRKLCPQAMDWYRHGVPVKTTSDEVKSAQTQSGRILGTDDSFSADDTSSEQASNAPSPSSPDRSSQWQVSENVVILYERPNVKSKPLGEFSKGAVVDVERETENWLRISRPDPGYLFKRQLKRLSPKS